MKELLHCVYGSHLYGTSTPTSDVDKKVVYLPDFDNVLLGKKHSTYKSRVDAEGNTVGGNDAMPDNGTEVEYIPMQTFCRDFLNGQTYALEVAFALVAGEKAQPEWLYELVERFLTRNVESMAGFAKKQTFDYVHRGVRLEKARVILATLEGLSRMANDFYMLDNPRLDSVIEGKKILHRLVQLAGAELGTTINNGKEMETLKLNGRDYLETTTLSHLYTAVDKLVDSYGHRTQAAAEAEVDRKSLMHAVRVYQQSLELLEAGKITFPRKNAAELLSVKTTMPLEEAKALLLSLEDQLAEAQATSELLPAKSHKMEAEFEEWLLGWLKKLYRLN